MYVFTFSIHLSLGTLDIDSSHPGYMHHYDHGVEAVILVASGAAVTTITETLTL